MVDPLKVEEILRLPPPCTIRQLQGLQGKANFLRRFIVNYANITKGFMRLLKWLLFTQSNDYTIIYFFARLLWLSDVNPFQYVLTRHIIGGKYNKWIVILQEFDLDFASAKSKKSLVFAELISDFPRLDEDVIHVDSFVDEHIFLVSSSTPGMETLFSFKL
jgi:hypothetical protein